MPGYISLHRDIQKHWLYEEERVFSRYEAWLDILMRVNHAEGKVTHNGTVETVQRGSTIWSIGDMEKHWGWSNRKVKRFLDCLVSDHMLAYKSTTKKTYITVENYDFYQGGEDGKAPPKHHQSTTDAFQKHTNNNVNNVNNNLSTTAAKENPFKLFETEGFGTLSATLGEKIGFLIDDFGERWVCEAMKQATYYGKRNLPYVKSILDRYKSSGVDEPWKEEKGAKENEKPWGGTKGVRPGSDAPKSSSNEGESKFYPSKWADAPLPKVSG